ncbi:MAG: flagellar hook-length control protein FliK [Nitrospirae bacterium]|nr:flagellar hook-length control protein FliK [Nitrospirota bacterium]
MPPIFLDITESLRPTGRGLGQQALFVPGESVQATVLEVLEPGRLTILVKGATLNASSLAGPLEPGQVIQARVERTGGQVLLKLEQPIVAQGPQQPVMTGKTGQLQLNQNIPQVLPSTAKAAALLSQAAAGLAASPVYTKELVTLAQAVAGRPQALVQVRGPIPPPPGQTEAEQPQSAERSGTTERGGAANQGRENDSPISLERQASAQPSQLKEVRGPLPTTLGKGLEAVETGKQVPANQALVSSRSAQAFVHTHTSDPDPIPQLLRMLLPADESFGSSLERLLSSVQTAVQRKILPEQAGNELERLHERLVLKTSDISGPQVKEAVLAKGLQHEQALLSLVDKGGDGNKGTVEPTLKGWLMATLAAHAKQNPAELVGEARAAWVLPGEPPQESAQGPLAGWVKDAHHMLRVVEREQVLNSLNVQTGQPLLIEVPLGPWAASSAWLYVSKLEGEGAGQQQGPAGRPYSLVTLLELDGIGAIRVDALLTGKRIAARFMVERQDIERAVTALLPILNKGLSHQGYQVEALTARVGEPSVIRGEELRARMVPSRSLVNVRV